MTGDSILPTSQQFTVSQGGRKIDLGGWKAGIGGSGGGATTPAASNGTSAGGTTSHGAPTNGTASKASPVTPSSAPSAGTSSGTTPSSGVATRARGSFAGAAIANVGLLRSRLRSLAPGVGGSLGQKRMKWMIQICDAWTLQELAEMKETEMEEVLQGWKEGKVVTKQSLLPWYRRTPLKDEWRRCPYHDRLSPDGSWFVPGLVGFTCGVATTFVVLLRIGRRMS